jgi:hypothetical protein
MGDLDADGTTDLLVGNPRFFWLAPGNASFVSGLSGEVIETFSEDGWRPKVNGDHFASYLAALGDLDGDGSQEAGLVVLDESLFYYRSYIVSAATRGIVTRIEGVDPRKGGLTSLARMGDVDQDGSGEWLVSKDPWGVREIELRSGLDGRVLYSMRAPSRHRAWGLDGDVSLVGDVDCDGIPDFAATGPESHPFAWASLFSGSDGSLLRRLSGGVSLEARTRSLLMPFGQSLVVTVESEDEGTFRALELDASGGRTLASSPDYRRVTSSCYWSAIDDRDGDSVPELIVLERWTSRLTVFSGRSGERLFDETISLPIEAEGAPGRAGEVFNVGDLDGDGGDELALQLEAPPRRIWRADQWPEDEQEPSYALCVLSVSRRGR